MKRKEMAAEAATKRAKQEKLEERKSVSYFLLYIPRVRNSIDILF